MSVTATDALSGPAGGEYFIGTDPGEGHGVPMALTISGLTATFGQTLPVGVYDVGVRARDLAGNWSPTTRTMLVVYDPAIKGVTGKNRNALTPRYGVDVLPGLVREGRLDTADYGFTVDWLNGGTLDPKNDFHFVYATGRQCNSPHPIDCHRFAIDATSFSWLSIDHENNSRARFQGVATVNVDGATSTNPFTIEALDCDRLKPSVADRVVLKVYPVGADPATAAPLYQVSTTLDRGTAVRVR